MQRAIDAGATPAELARGDTVFKGAESLSAQSRLPEAMVQLATAASLWAEVERQSRARAARDTQARRAAEPPARSEERRVGKEGRARGAAWAGKRKRGSGAL